jgi:N-hydroxyarylamine O-acetyltransferase
MQSNNFDLSCYFRRINYTGPAAADSATLHKIMRHQLFTVPFENLDVQAGKVVSLVPEEICDKILHQGRGATVMRSTGCLPWRWKR